MFDWWFLAALKEYHSPTGSGYQNINSFSFKQVKKLYPARVALNISVVKSELLGVLYG